MDPHLLEWLTLLARWLHVTAGVAWIGASFYFIWLDLSIRRPDPPREGVKGELFAVHGGGFYRAEKYELAPPAFPKTLHWFYWEAYTTWLSGVLLLGLVYWAQASSYLVRPDGLSPRQAISLSAISLIAGWWGYDRLCRSRLAADPRKLAGVGFVALVAIAALLQHAFNPRAAWLHLGAMVGTMMAGNVFFVIIPGQRRMVELAKKGLGPDPEDGRRAKLRSTHNNYLTLPVLLVMVSNHYPMLYAHPWGWALFAGILAVGAGVRHWFNRRHSGENLWWIWPLVAAGILALGMVSRPAAMPAAERAVGWAEVQPILQARCLTCHATAPTDAVWKAPPLGLVLETPEQVRAAAQKVHQRAVVQKNMPLANQTGMTEAERAVLAAWLAGQP